MALMTGDVMARVSPDYLNFCSVTVSLFAGPRRCLLLGADAGITAWGEDVAADLFVSLAGLMSLPARIVTVLPLMVSRVMMVFLLIKPLLVL